MNNKKNKIKQKIKNLNKVAIAYSGGIDSTLLVKISMDALDRKRVLAIMVRTELVSEYNFKHAVKTLKQINSSFAILKKSLLCNKKILDNPIDRCYWCKKELFSTIINYARLKGFENILDGTNYNDIKESYRPGIKVLRELNIMSPFADFNITKDEIRNWAFDLKLPNWNKPPDSCLATRIPYNKKLEKPELKAVELAENYLKILDMAACRVRVIKGLARIEVDKKDFEKILNRKNRKKIIDKFKKLGFKYITLDLEGFRSGSIKT